MPHDLPPNDLPRRLFAEALGTAFLLATVVGSGIMAAKLAGGNQALALLCNAIATGAALTVLILMLGPVSGAHFNPAVSLTLAARGELPWREALSYSVVQVIGGIAGTIVANLMFDLPAVQISQTIRTGFGQWLAETVATFGLLLTILGCVMRARELVAYAVGLYITAAYWFTSSTSFANPAVTIARAFSDTFAGIAPGSVLPFVVAQGVGAIAAYWVARMLFATPRSLPGKVADDMATPQKPGGHVAP